MNKFYRNLLFCLKIFPVLSVFILLYSCEKQVNIDLNTPNYERVVVEGRVTDQYLNHLIRLTKTTSYFYNQPAPPLTSAEAYILEEGSQKKYNLTLTDSAKGVFSGVPFAGIPGETYSLIVSYEGQRYKASSFLDKVTVMDSISYKYKYTNFFGQKVGNYIISMSAYEPEPAGDVYLFYIYLNDTLINKKISRSIMSDDQAFNGQYLDNVEIYYLRQEEIVKDTNKLRVEMLSVSKDEYDFINAFNGESQNGGSIFSGPPSNIPSNLINTSGGLNGLGFFGASAVTSKEMTLIKQHDDSTNDPKYKP
jgi:hypothetical protein